MELNDLKNAVGIHCGGPNISIRGSVYEMHIGRFLTCKCERNSTDDTFA